MRIDYDHLGDPDIFAQTSDLRIVTSHDPDKARRPAKKAVLRILKELDPEYCEVIEKLFHVEFSNAPIEKEIPDLSVDDLGTFMKVTGTMTISDERSTSLVHETTWICEPYGHRNKIQGAEKPRRCKGPAKESTVEDDEGPKELEGCDSFKFTKDEKASYIEDFIRFDIQQRSERAVEAKTPASLQVEVMGSDNVDWVKKNLEFGQYLSISGIPRTKAVKHRSGQDKAIADIYLEASTIEILPEHYFEKETDPELDEIIKDTIRHSQILNKILDSKKMLGRN